VSGGRFALLVRADDGYFDRPADNQRELSLIEELAVDHGERGTAPTVTVLDPNGGGTVIGSTTIGWMASDPDVGDALTIDIALLRLDADGQVLSEEPIATGLPNEPSSFAWDASGVEGNDAQGQPIPYKIRVSATDSGGLNTRSDDSDQSFSVVSGGGSTELGWDDVRPIFVEFCGACHGQPAKSVALEYFRMDKYDAADPQAPANGDLGVFDVKDLVFERLVSLGNMPPVAQPQPSQLQIDQVEEWLVAGAPLGGGGDLPPSFSWQLPNDSATTTVASTDVTLQWTAADPEGLPLTGSISMAELPDGPPPLNPATASCTGSEAGYVDVVTGSAVNAGSATISLPGPGYYCFQAQVSDAGGHSTTVLATRPVRF
jgi:hypothetical protein